MEPVRRLLPGMLLAVAGCSGDVVHFREPPDAGSSSFARLRITLSVTRDGQTALASEARLLRFRDVDPESAGVLAGASVPSLDELPLGRCVRVDGDQLLAEALAGSSPDAAVAMLDAGEVVVRAGDRAVRLTPRYVPEVVPFVSGVEYEAEEDTIGRLPPLSLRAGDEAFVSAFGGQDVGRFDATATIPSVPRVVAAGLDADGNLRVRWVAEPDAADGVVVSVASGHGGGTLRCRVANGATYLTIPRTLIDSGEGSSETVELAVERIARTPFAAAGMDDAEIEVGVRDVVIVPIGDR